jgi:hypothetical protein
MTDYTATLYNTSATWITAIAAVTATKLVAAGAYQERGKTVWYTVVAA